MTKRVLILSMLVLAFLFPGYSSAELYMYKDKDGNVHFTNNTAEIPADLQSEAKRLPEKKGYKVPAPKPSETVGDDEPEPSEKKAGDETADTAPAEESSEAKEEQKDPAVLKDLQGRKAALDNERAELEAFESVDDDFACQGNSIEVPRLK